MLVSLVIPSFQQASLLRGALQSIKNQIFKDYEIIVMDGGSTDGTAAIVREFKQLPVTIYSEPDNGIYDAMNKGIARSTGDFIYFMGCDDRLYAFDTLKNVFSTPGIINNHVIYGDVVFSDTGKRYDGEFNDFKLMAGNICHQAIFVRREVFEKLGNFDIRYKTYADWEHNMRWFSTSWVKRQYLSIIIANFNTSGFSSQLQDELFFGELEHIRNKYFPKIIRYLAANPYRPLHWRLIKFLTSNRILLMRKIASLLK